MRRETAETFERELLNTAEKTGLFSVLESIKKCRNVLEVGKILILLKTVEILYKQQGKEEESRKISLFRQKAREVYRNLLTGGRKNDK